MVNKSRLFKLIFVDERLIFIQRNQLIVEFVVILFFIIVFVVFLFSRNVIGSLFVSQLFFIIYFLLFSYNGSVLLNVSDMANCFGLTALISSLDERLFSRNSVGLCCGIRNCFISTLSFNISTLILVNSKGFFLVYG